MENILTYHSKTKNKKHIFAYCVGARSASTAIQRILNSSNQVWLWGEQHYLIDETVALINEMKRLKETGFVKISTRRLNICFKKNKHDLFYPNAIGNLKSTTVIQNSSISNLLKPTNNKIDRFGFKDIRIINIQTIEYLRKLYKNSFFVFCFRNPLNQWPSVNKLKWWKYGKKINLFLNEIEHVSNIYLEFARKFKIKCFVEDEDLRDIKKVRKLTKYLGLKKIDETLINKTVNTAEAKKISARHKKIILHSQAYKNYLKMKKSSNQFFKNT